jgi:hypothetical protein
MSSEKNPAEKWFDDLTILADMPPEQAAAKLEELGEHETALQIRQFQGGHAGETFAGPRKPSWLSKPWKHASHTYGFIEPAAPGADALPIRFAGDIQPDTSLKGKRIKITLDRLRVAGYPGFGTHQILFDFYAKNQVPKIIEHLHFNATYRAADGEHVGVIGYPIFIGLNVSTEGVDFKCLTVNVKNEDDERFLGLLDSDVFKAGLKLASTAQPAIAPLAGLAVGITRAIATRNRNVPVQNFYMGLDFSTTPSRARLRAGSYVAVQIPESLDVAWDWKEWVFQTSSGRLVNAQDSQMLIPYNYLVFGVSLYEGPDS